jgi:hypothetical protein
MSRKSADLDDSLRCSFCHKSQEVVGKLISSPSDYPRAYICDECIAVCNSILEDERSAPVSEALQEETDAHRNELQTVVDGIPDGDIPAALKILRALEDRWHLLS